MKLHTNSHTGSSITAALRTVKDRGQVSNVVGFEVFSEHGSRSHDRAYEIQLGWYGFKVKGDGRRWKNSGKNGAADVYAATYSEWGWLILELFTLDPEMTFGSYKSLEDFHRQTKDAFNVPERLEYLRAQLQAECISYGELAELQSLSSYIDAGDLELLEAAGVPETV